MSETASPPSLSTASPEAESLLAVLERNRRTFAWKTSGLDEKGLRATTAASSMTLGGLVKHLALVEADWLAVKLAGQQYGAPWDAVDFDADPDWDWRTGALDAPDEVYAIGERRLIGRGHSSTTSSPSAGWTERPRSPGRTVARPRSGSCCWT